MEIIPEKPHSIRVAFTNLNHGALYLSYSMFKSFQTSDGGELTLRKILEFGNNENMNSSSNLLKEDGYLDANY